jgi:hypothetical protein
MAEVPWGALLSSSLVGGVVGALLAGFFTLAAKRNDFLNSYYKTVIDRRIAAYEQLEKLIVMLKSSVIGVDNRPCHLLFSRDDDWDTAYKLMFDIMSQSLWLSDGLFIKSRDLSDLMYRSYSKEGGAIEFGKKNYKTIAILREEIERLHADDMLQLHDVTTFLKRRRTAVGGFREFHARRESSEKRPDK